MKTVSAPLRTHLDRDVTAMATCWEIIRRDGKTYRFTDSDEDITVEGITYLAIGAYSRTAIESTASLAVDNLEIQGIFNELTLPVTELRAGAFDFAEVRVFACSWMQNQNPGLIKLRRGFFGEITVLPNGTFKAELRGIMQRLSNDFTQVYSAHCLNDFGDFSCGVATFGPYVKNGDEVKNGQSYTFLQSTVAQGTRENLAIKDATFSELASSGLLNSRYWWDQAETGTNGGDVEHTLLGPHREVQGSVAGAVLTQDVPLLSGKEITGSLIDAGAVRITLKAFLLGGDANARFRIGFLDSARTLIGGSVFYNSTFVSPDSWTEYGIDDAVVPATARMVRIYFDAQDGAGTATEARFSRPYGWMLNTSASTNENPYALYDRSFKATGFGTAGDGGTVGDAIPSSAVSGTGAGQSVILDGATFQAGTKNFVVGKVIQVKTPTEIEVALWRGDEEWVTGWFEIGTVQFQSGKNKGKGMEVKAWNSAGGDNSAGSLKLFMSLPYLPDIGDTFVMIPGCDKTRICCRAIWNNVANMFAAPDVPGEDNIFEYPDSKA